MAERESLARRLALVAAPGGARASVRWVVRRLSGIDAHSVLARSLTGAAERQLGAWSAEQLVVVTEDNIDGFEPALLGQLDANNGCRSSDTTASGGRIYALRVRDTIACQARIEFGTSITDSPLPMIIHLGPRNAFLSYLYTGTAHRRTGAARALLALVTRHLADERRWDHCVCHVQATNVRSLNAFRSAGFSPIASIWTRGHRLLHVSQSTAARSLPLAFHLIDPGTPPTRTLDARAGRPSDRI